MFSHVSLGTFFYFLKNKLTLCEKELKWSVKPLPYNCCLYLAEVLQKEINHF